MKVAFIGLGDIGGLMAGHLARDPFDLVVWNRTAAKAETFARDHKARVARTPADAVKDASVVITCLPSSMEVEAVLHGENGMRQPHTLNASSPTTARTMRITASERKSPSVAVV